MPSSPGLWVWLGRGRYCLGRVQLEEERAAGRGVGVYVRSVLSFMKKLLSVSRVSAIFYNVIKKIPLTHWRFI